VEEPSIDPRSVIALRGWQSNIIRSIRAVSTSPAVDAILQRVRNVGRSQVDDRHQLGAYESRLFSQNGEAGILKEIFFRLGHGNRYFVEFGVGDGSECNSALLAQRYGWNGVYIEGAETLYESLRKRYEQREGIRCIRAMITAENICELFASASVPQEFDLLSIDVDGNDFWLWRELRNYRPRVVVVEYNAAYRPPVRWIMQYNPTHHWDGTTHFGASLTSFADLAREHGYALLGTDKNGVNAFFLRRDLLANSGFREVTPEEGYHLPRYGMTGVPHPYRPGPYLTVPAEVAVAPVVE
jgi:hypothetical protein